MLVITLNNKVARAVGLLDLRQSSHPPLTSHTEDADGMLLQRRRWQQAQSHAGVLCRAKASDVERLPLAGAML